MELKFYVEHVNERVFLMLNSHELTLLIEQVYLLSVLIFLKSTFYLVILSNNVSSSL